ncbi:hypothetical protein KEM54_006114 [Ascosphaera aggregata]|nr:hypothetical protein KEM54_006114 [Ascosphaera aggregata]
MTAIYPNELTFSAFPSRRSVVHSTKGIVSCTQPLAAAAGQRVLNEGGNAADAAVAVAAALNVTEPCSTGIGGDMFCLFYNAKTRQVHALNGSGRSPKHISLEQIRSELGLADDDTESGIPFNSAHAVTVPGAAAGWIDTVEKFGSKKLSLEQILQAAIELGEEGFPVSELTANAWAKSEDAIRKASPNFREMLKEDDAAIEGARAPKAGELMKNPTLARTFRTLGREGREGFYEGRIAEEIVKVVQAAGGRITLEDLRDHCKEGSQEVAPISLKFDPSLFGGREFPKSPLELWEHPPNGQGIVALMAMGILQELARQGKILFKAEEHNSTAYLHALIQCLRIAFADARWWVTDPDVEEVPVKELISQPYLAERGNLFDANSAGGIIHHGSPANSHSDTAYFAVTDEEGNGMSFIISNYGGFGTCIIPEGCGFTLQNRGANFSLAKGHPNVVAPRKRPYHTIIPGLVTNVKDQSLHSVFGVMGGFMQPQGHVQVLLNQTVFGYSPQEALDAPRFCIAADECDTVYLEEGLPEDVIEGLKRLGHQVKVLSGLKRAMFGRGQIIRSRMEDGKMIYSAGSDQRGDGAALPAL